MVAQTYDGPRISVTVTRNFDASPEKLFAAWVEPQLANKWLFTTKTSTAEHVLDARVGGTYRIVRRRDGKEYVAVGEYKEVAPPHRLVFTFGMPQFAADFDTVAVDLEPVGAGCRLTLTQSGLRPGYDASTVKGWEKMFDLLEQAL
jgi:uncharacterized protein YndB with AHSA1/START domain